MLSKKAHYALQALSYLCDCHGCGPTSVAQIAEQKGISVKFLEQILLELKNDGVLQSKKGKGGGYVFNVNPEEIPLLRVIRLMNGPVALLPCASLNYFSACECCNPDTCSINQVFAELRDQQVHFLSQRTVSDLQSTASA